MNPLENIVFPNVGDKKIRDAATSKCNNFNNAIASTLMLLESPIKQHSLGIIINDGNNKSSGFKHAGSSRWFDETRNGFRTRV